MTPNDNDQSVCASADEIIGLGALAFGAAAFLAPGTSVAEGAMQAWWDDVTGDLKDLAEDVREAAAYFLGMESYVYRLSDGHDGRNPGCADRGAGAEC